MQRYFRLFEQKSKAEKSKLKIFPSVLNKKIDKRTFTVSLLLFYARQARTSLLLTINNRKIIEKSNFFLFFYLCASVFESFVGITEEICFNGSIIVQQQFF